MKSEKQRKHLEKLNKSKIGTHHTKEAKIKMSNNSPKFWLGKKKLPLSENIKRKIGKANSKEKSHWWKGGRSLSTNGQVQIVCLGHPKASKHGNYVYEHRLIMEKFLGRYLENWEMIHHKNGIKTDNRLENLEIVMRKAHFGQVRCPYCQKDFLIR